MTIPGLESIAAEEIVQELGGEVKRTAPGLVVFRPDQLDTSVLRLRTVEDVFLLLWGTDQLTYRARDLDLITRWTAQEPDWPRMLQCHHAIRPKPRGKPTYRLVTQMQGEHGYRRVDARKALAQGLAGKLPSSWRWAEEDAAVEIWLTIDGATAVSGLRLSDKTMRHRTYKEEHLPASLRPVVAAAMVRLADLAKGDWLLDPMCGAGTILAERLAVQRDALVLGGDLEPAALRSAAANLRRLGQPLLARWDAGHLPLRNESVDALVTNPPFGKQLGLPEEITGLYRRVLEETHRVLRPGSRAVLLVSEIRALTQAARRQGWRLLRQERLRILGQAAYLSVWQKPGEQ
jgi:23S rRNA G2445 N2-methylase RlmL